MWEDIEEEREDKKCDDYPADLKVALREIWVDIAKRSNIKRVQDMKFVLQFQLSSRFAEYSMWPVLVLSEAEEQIFSQMDNCLFPRRISS